MNKTADEIFKNGSKTYYFSSIFFPPEVRQKVTSLYAYVRTVDDFVDTMPPDKKAFFAYKQATLDTDHDNEIIHNFLRLAKENNVQKVWIEAFLHSMELDLEKKSYADFAELEEYIYGSANVIGYMMAAIMQLPQAAYEYAGLQGKAMQLINFIRDIKEDHMLGRVYLPKQDMENFEVDHIIPKTPNQKANFIKLIQFEIARYFQIQDNAEKGYQYIPKRYLIPIKTAAQMYHWTARQIYKDPLLVLEKKLKPSKARILTNVIKHCITL